MNKVNPLKTCTMADANVMHSNEYVEGGGICSSYADGKCLETPGKYCDGCASETGIL